MSRAAVGHMESILQSAWLSMPDPDPWCQGTQHGDANAYQHFWCRCTSARRAASKANNQYKLIRSSTGKILVPALGSRRRLRALAREGWSFNHVAAELGEHTHRCNVAAWARDAPTLRRTSAEQIAELYARWEFTPGPSLHAAHRAAGKGWPGTERWFGLDMDDPEAEPMTLRCIRHLHDAEVDEVVVARLISHAMPADAANRHERREATRQLWAAGLTTTEVARRLAEDERVVSRDVKWLQARGLADRRAP